MFQQVNARLRQGTVGTNGTRIVASETLRVSCQENFKAGALRQRVGK